MGQTGDSKPLLWEAGIDWLTLTAPGDDEHTHALGELFGDMLTRQEEYGETLKEQGWSGFHGPGTKHIFFGRKDWGVMARASSSFATHAAKEVIERGIQARCTRIDFQATVQAREALPGFAAAQRQAIKTPATGKAKARPRDIALYESSDGGSGVAVGDRSSSRCGRIYDKTAEQRFKVAPRLWRYEVEFKEGQSRAFWDKVRAAPDVEKLAVSSVVSYFSTVNIKEPWMLDIAPLQLPSTYRQTTDEKAMEWLVKLIGGTITRLASRGHEEWLRHWFEACVADGLEKPDARGALASQRISETEANAIIERLAK